MGNWGRGGKWGERERAVGIGYPLSTPSKLTTDGLTYILDYSDDAKDINKPLDLC